jgi:hypothetical protein
MRTCAWVVRVSMLALLWCVVLVRALPREALTLHLNMTLLLIAAVRGSHPGIQFRPRG